jgi:hypothetical protein
MVACAVLIGSQSLLAAEPLAVFPDPNWPRSPEWQRALDRHAPPNTYDTWLRIHAGDSWASVVTVNGFLVYEGSGAKCPLTQANDCGSSRKALQSTVLGAALYQGKLKSIDEDAMPYWKDPFLTPYKNDRTITFRQFAQYHDRWDDPEPPGTYHYNNASATAAGACIAGLFREVRGPRPIGICEVVRSEVMQRINADWHLSYAKSDFTLRSGDSGPQMVFQSDVYEYAKLGYLWLHKGRWANQRIFSDEYYREATTDWSPHTGDASFGKCGHYGYWWFVNHERIWLPAASEDAFYVVGNGQPKRATMLLIIPSTGVVAALSMERLSDDGKWDVIQNSRIPSNEGPRLWSQEIVKLRAGISAN